MRDKDLLDRERLMKTIPTTKPRKYIDSQRGGDCPAAPCSLHECEGRCSVTGKCRGEIGYYYTFSGARCWGGSYYCEEGAQITQEMGYRIERVCGTCDGSGAVDTGGVLPWGAAAMDECPECRIFRANA